ADGRRVVALACGPDVLLTSAMVPTQSKQRLARAVPYALEDQLAEDVEDLHFATGQMGEEGRLAVAVVDRALMDGWVEALAEAGLDADQVYPEQLAVPLETDSWAVVVDGERFLLRYGAQGGLAGDAANLADMLEACLLEAEDAQPAKIVVHDYSGHATLPNVEPAVEHRAVDSEDATALLATSLDERRAIPMLVGEYAKSSGWRAHWQRWRAVAVLAALWVVLSTGQAYIEQWQLREEAAQLEQQIIATYRQAFPDADRVIDPRGQMESRLAAMRNQGQGGGQGVLPLLAKVGPVLRGESGLQLTALSYRGGDLDLELYAESLQSIDQLKQRLGRLEGVSVEVRSAKAEGERVQGRLRIQETT
ncbi:type II secretion system protein GspL, partial [Ectothiorhodospiraceae bacterium WFHF3C12]|nr:type II secretion system protein GspL [Ectothiorhodospiraceae bacterium WFHF3C12]